MQFRKQRTFNSRQRNFLLCVTFLALDALNSGENQNKIWSTKLSRDTCLIPSHLCFFTICEALFAPPASWEAWTINRCYHGLFNYRDTKAKCRHLKKLTFKGTLWQVFLRVYKLDIQSVRLIFSTQLCELLHL
jgi:hypothetical protein